MATYDFPYYTLETIYPESSALLRYGRGYEFASAPRGPDQIGYRLHYAGFKAFLNADGSWNVEAKKKHNIRVLELFYQTHRLWKTFTFPHPAEGDKTVRFGAPLSWKLLENGGGVTEPITIELRLQP